MDKNLQSQLLQLEEYVMQLEVEVRTNESADSRIACLNLNHTVLPVNLEQTTSEGWVQRPELSLDKLCDFFFTWDRGSIELNHTLFDYRSRRETFIEKSLDELRGYSDTGGRKARVPIETRFTRRRRSIKSPSPHRRALTKNRGERPGTRKRLTTPFRVPADRYRESGPTIDCN